MQKPYSLTFIRTLAEEYAAKYNPDSVAPFPYANVMKEHPDLEVYFAELDDPKVSGITLFKDGVFNILVNTSKAETRQNFTLAHELGHYFLHQEILKDSPGIVDGDPWLDGAAMLYLSDEAKSTQTEIEANNFAASLIMPAHLVRKAWDVTKDVEECAEIFRVSVVAMSVRLTRLGLVK